MNDFETGSQEALGRASLVLESTAPASSGRKAGEPPADTSDAVGKRARASVAIGVLVFCCVLWGWSFPTMQYASRAFDTHIYGHSELSGVESLASRGFLNGMRFLTAGLLYALLTWKSQNRFTRTETVGGVVVGLLFGAGMLLQVLGLAWARPSVSGFLTSMAVVFAPMAQALILRRAVGGVVWVAVGLALAGVTLLACPNPEASHAGLTVAAPVPFLGEILTLLAAIIFTAQILAVDHYGQAADPRRLTSVMMLTCSILSLGVAVGLSGGRVVMPEVMSGLALDRTVWWSLGSLVLFSSVLAIPLMNTFQPRVSPATASVVYCTEPLFALVFSVLLGAEHLTALTLGGGGAVLAGVLLVASRSGAAAASGKRDAEPEEERAT